MTGFYSLNCVFITVNLLFQTDCENSLNFSLGDRGIIRGETVNRMLQDTACLPRSPSDLGAMAIKPSVCRHLSGMKQGLLMLWRSNEMI